MIFKFSYLLSLHIAIVSHFQFPLDIPPYSNVSMQYPTHFSHKLESEQFGEWIYRQSNKQINCQVCLKCFAIQEQLHSIEKRAIEWACKRKCASRNITLFCTIVIFSMYNILYLNWRWKQNISVMPIFTNWTMQMANSMAQIIKHYQFQ